ncbi:MAG: hypothetical protein RIA62_02340 [Cyclobacteriaceae bacterium]
MTEEKKAMDIKNNTAKRTLALVDTLLNPMKFIALFIRLENKHKAISANSMPEY